MGQANYTATTGTSLEENKERPVQVACAEFSTSRLFIDHLSTARLVVTTHNETEADGASRTIIDIPLIEYLMLIRGFGDSWIKSDQEFLDRQSRWTLMFFLQSGKWQQSRIVVNDWIVRVNHAEF